MRELMNTICLTCAIEFCNYYWYAVAAGAPSQLHLKQNDIILAVAGLLIAYLFEFPYNPVRVAAVIGVTGLNEQIWL